MMETVAYDTGALRTHDSITFTKQQWSINGVWRWSAINVQLCQRVLREQHKRMRVTCMVQWHVASGLGISLFRYMNLRSFNSRGPHDAIGCSILSPMYGTLDCSSVAILGSALWRRQSTAQVTWWMKITGRLESGVRLIAGDTNRLDWSRDESGTIAVHWDEMGAGDLKTSSVQPQSSGLDQVSGRAGCRVRVVVAPKVARVGIAEEVRSVSYKIGETRRDLMTMDTRGPRLRHPGLVSPDSCPEDNLKCWTHKAIEDGTVWLKFTFASITILQRLKLPFHSCFSCKRKRLLSTFKSQMKYVRTFPQQSRPPDPIPHHEPSTA